MLTLIPKENLPGQEPTPASALHYHPQPERGVRAARRNPCTAGKEILYNQEFTCV
jgi:hypothetical protein